MAAARTAARQVRRPETERQRVGREGGGRGGTVPGLLSAAGVRDVQARRDQLDRAARATRTACSRSRLPSEGEPQAADEEQAREEAREGSQAKIVPRLQG